MEKAATLIKHLAQQVKNLPAIQEIPVQFRKIHWRRGKLFTTVFLGFPCASAVKESACSVGDLDSISGLGRSPGEGKDSIFWPGEFHGLYSPWCRKESDMTE